MFPLFSGVELPNQERAARQVVRVTQSAFLRVSTKRIERRAHAMLAASIEANAIMGVEIDDG